MKTHFSTPQSNMMSDQDMSGTSISSKPSSRIFQPIQLKGVELPVLSRYAFALSLLIVCVLILLWSRLDLRETRVSLSQAQQKYKEAIEEQHRLQLELDSLLAPSSIRSTIQDFDFTTDINVVEVTNPTTSTSDPSNLSRRPIDAGTST